MSATRSRSLKHRRTQARAIFERLAAANPQPRTELEYGSGYQLLVAVVLSAQATDKSVNLATRRLFALAPTPRHMLALGEERVRELIASIGLYKTKARHVMALSALLLERHQGEVPNDQAALEALPGVGHKTANVVRNTLYRVPVMAVDTHIFRVANRTGMAPGKTVQAVEAALLQSTPAEFLLDAHHWLILHGRYVCKARQPDCPGCLIRDLCLYPDKTP